MENYTTGTGQTIRVHNKNDDCMEGCAIHNPSPSPVTGFPTHWREDRRLMERICPHGIGHPDPDHLKFVMKLGGPLAVYSESMHGCDGCCSRTVTPDP